MAKDKKTRKFAAVKRMISPKDMRINSVRKSASAVEEKKKKAAAPKQMYARAALSFVTSHLHVSVYEIETYTVILPVLLNSDQIPSNLFFKYNAELGPPYNVLVDTNFINFSIKNKLEVVSAMMDCLLAKCVPCITDCVMAELERLGHKYRVALRLAKDPRFERLPCTHKGTYADDCLLQRVQQHRCYLVATCDRELKRRIRKVPGVPIMYISNRKYVIERLPEANAARIKYDIAFGLFFVAAVHWGNLSDMKSSLEEDKAPSSSSRALRQYAAQREELLGTYFTDTKLLQVLQSFLSTLATDFRFKRVLPASPYPRLLAVIRQNEVKRSLVLNGTFSEPNDASTSPELLMHDQQQQQRTAPQFRLCSTKELLTRALWGFQGVIERISDVAQLLQRVDAIREMQPTWFDDGKDDQRDDDQYRVTVFPALVSHATSFSLAQYPVIEVEQHVVVAGELLEKAMAVFARQLFKFLHELSTNSSTMGCSGICITSQSVETSSSVSGGITLIGSDLQQQPQVWTTESVNSNRNAFIAAVKIAIVDDASFEISSFSSTTESLSALPVSTNSSLPRFICQTRQRFFLHFVRENTTTSSTKPVKASQQHQQQSHSFVIGMRALESGVFLGARGALEIARRVQLTREATTTGAGGNAKEKSTNKQQPAQAGTNKRPNAISNAPSTFSLWSTAERLIASNLEKVFRLQSSPPNSHLEEARKWTKCFMSSHAFALLTLVLRNQMLIDLLLEAHDDAVAACKEALQSHFETSGCQLELLLEQARVGSTSSLLKSVQASLETLWQKAHNQFQLFIKDSSDGNQGRDAPSSLIQLMETVNELLLVVARVAVRDFVELVRSYSPQPAVEMGSEQTTLAQNDEETPQKEEQQIDVLRALQTAVDERAYPPIVALECVFAQFLVDSCLDVALESAVLNIVAFHLPPNPFVELSRHLCVFALRQHVWSRPLSSASSIENKSQVQAQKDSEVVLMKPSSHTHRALYGNNRSLLGALDPEQVWKAHQWLQQNGILRPSDYPQPPKSSYSIQVSHSLLAYHPTALATNQSLNSVITCPFLQELEIVEHVVIEGREYNQALAFFADAVAHDLLRVAGLYSNSNAHDQLLVPIQAEIRSPLDEIVSAVSHHMGNSDFGAALLELVQEATRSKCVLRVQLTFFNELASGPPNDREEDAARLHIVGKTYVFQHKATESDPQQQPHECISELLAFRLKRFGVFFAPENAEYVLETLERNLPTENIPQEFWTPFAHQALAHEDVYLKYELDFGAPKASVCTTRYHATADHKNGILMQRLTEHSWTVQLYAIETACEWFLRHFEKRQGDQQSSIKPQMPLAKLFTQSLESLIRHVERILLPLTAQMRYLEWPEERFTAFQQLLSRLSSTSSHPGNANESTRLMSMKRDALRMLRQTWVLVLYARFSYQRDFFANY